MLTVQRPLSSNFHERKSSEYWSTTFSRYVRVITTVEEHLGRRVLRTLPET